LAAVFRHRAGAPQTGGKALVQSITIAERHFPRYRSSTDFIQQYIFPGGMLPSVERFERSAARAGLHSEGHYAFGRDYAETLRRWRSALPRRARSGGGARLRRPFHAHLDLYFAYCEAAFDEEGRTDVVQFLLHKRRRRLVLAALLAAATVASAPSVAAADWRTQLPQAQALAVATCAGSACASTAPRLWSASRPFDAAQPFALQLQLLPQHQPRAPGQHQHR
jgi:hypothetical protein